MLFVSRQDCGEDSDGSGWTSRSVGWVVLWWRAGEGSTATGLQLKNANGLVTESIQRHTPSVDPNDLAV